MICYLNAFWCSNGNAYLDAASFSTIASRLRDKIMAHVLLELITGLQVREHYRGGRQRC